MCAMQEVILQLESADAAIDVPPTRGSTAEESEMFARTLESSLSGPDAVGHVQHTFFCTLAESQQGHVAPDETDLSQKVGMQKKAS